jgi:hypothetical protein
VKYLCLMYIDECRAAGLTAAEMDAVQQECALFREELHAGGRFIASAKLAPAREAATVRAREGRISVTDGPFAETGEQLGGFYLIEARDLNEAIQVAARVPPGRLGSVEVRPLAE